MKWKELFCKHIYKQTGEEELGITRKPFGQSSGFTTYSNFRNIAITWECVKCPKKKISTKQVMLI